MTVDGENVASGKGPSPWFFFALTFALTWIFWVPLALSGQNVLEGPLMIALLLGGFGPSVAGIIMVYWTRGRQGGETSGVAPSISSRSARAGTW